MLLLNFLFFDSLQIPPIEFSKIILKWLNHQGDARLLRVLTIVVMALVANQMSPFPRLTLKYCFPIMINMKGIV